MSKKSSKAGAEGMGSGKGNFANMPTEVKMKPYPKQSYGMHTGIDDTIVGIDANAKSNTKGIRKTTSNGMY